MTNLEIKAIIKQQEMLGNTTEAIQIGNTVFLYVNNEKFGTYDIVD